MKDSQNVVVASWFMKVAAIVIYVIGAIFGSLLILCPDNLADGAVPTIITIVVITGCVGTAMLIKSKCMDKQRMVIEQTDASNLEAELAKQRKKSKRTNIALLVTTLTLIIAVITSITVYNSPKQQMLRTCKEFGLDDAKISLTCYTNYSGYAFYRTQIYCNGFSSLDDKLKESFFFKIWTVDAEGKIFSDEDTTVYSDGKVFTLKGQDINGKRIKVIYIDGKAMDSRYDESNKVKCTACNGIGSYSCKDCNGRGRRPMKSYSEGDWGFESYTSYECTDCNGRGRIDCGRCYGEGYYYNIEN